MEHETQIQHEIRLQELVESYLRDRLPEWFRDAFNERLMDDPELAHQVDLREALEGGLKLEERAGRIERWNPQDAGRGATAGGGDRGPRTEAFEPAGRPRRFGRRHWAIAASFLLALLSATLLVQNLTLRSGDLAGAQRSQLVPLLATRGTEPVAVRIEPDGAPWLVLLADPGVDYDVYRATVTSTADPQEQWTLDNLERGYLEMIPIMLPAGQLENGTYTVLIEGRNAGAGAFVETARLSFRASAE